MSIYIYARYFVSPSAVSVYIRPLWHSVHTAPAPAGNNLIYRAGAKRVKTVRTRHIYVIDHEIISSDIDGSCDVYSSLKFVNPLDENGLLICFFI